ncbi:hypothetical protein MHU86_24545 [Fragilaria crotonensis]|nr:hypothetical protein MHU86_24545 [Fragilaria crotonensis]
MRSEIRNNLVLLLRRRALRPKLLNMMRYFKCDCAGLCSGWAVIEVDVRVPDSALVATIDWQPRHPAHAGWRGVLWRRSDQASELDRLVQWPMEEWMSLQLTKVMLLGVSWIPMPILVLQA